MKRRPEDHVEMRPWVARAFSPGMRVFLFCKAFGNAAGNGETATTSAKAAAKRRQNAAHGVSRGSATAKYSAAQRRKVLQQISAGPNHGLRAFCRPAGLVIDLSRPTAHAVGCILAPLRGSYASRQHIGDGIFPPIGSLPPGHARPTALQAAAGEQFLR